MSSPPFLHFSFFCPSPRRLKSHLSPGVLIVKSLGSHSCPHTSMRRSSFHNQLFFSVTALQLSPNNTSVTSDTRLKLGVRHDGWRKGGFEPLNHNKANFPNFFTSTLLSLFHLKTFCLIHRPLWYTCPRTVVSGWDLLFLSRWSTAVTFRLTGRMIGRSSLGLTPDQSLAK